MSDPNDAWQSAPSDNNYDRERSPRRDDRERERDRSPPPAPRNRSRSPARNGGGGGGDDRDRGRAPEQTNAGDNLHVSGLAKAVSQTMLHDMFSKHGKVYKAELMTDPHTQESRGFGFVKMESAADAEACIEALNQTVVEGKTMTVAHARRGRARTPTPGRYHGVKVDIGGPRYGGGGGYGGGYGGDRPYQPRSYDSRYDPRGPPRGYDDRRYDDRGPPRYDDRRYDDRRDYRPRYDDRGPPPSDRYDRAPAAYDRRDERPRYADERPPRY